MIAYLPPLALNESDQPMLLWWIVGASIALGPAIHSWIKIIEFWRGKSADLSQFVTKSELAQVKAERDLQIKVTFESIATGMADMKKSVDRMIDSQEEINRTVTEDIKVLNRVVGELEGASQGPKNPRRR